MAVQQTFTGDANSLIRELDKLNAAYAKLEQKMSDTSSASEKSARGVETAMRDASSTLTGMITQYISLEAGIRAVTAARERDEQIQQRSLDAHERLAAAQTDLLRNAGKDFDDLTSRLAGVQQRTKIDITSLTEATSAGISTRAQGMTNQQLISTVEVAAGMMREQPSGIAGFVSALNLVQGATGITDPRTAAGFLQSAASMSAIQSATRFGERVGPAIVSATVEDPQDRMRSAVEAAAMFSMFTQRGDVTGELSRSTTIGMISGLAGFMEGPSDPGSTLGRIQALQQNEALRSRFLSKPIEGVSLALRAPAQNLFDPKSSEYATFAANIAATQVSPEPFDALMGRMGTATPSMAFAESRRAGKSAVEVQDLSGEARYALAREKLYEGLAMGHGMGAWLFEQYAKAGHAYEISSPFIGGGVDPVESAMGILREKRGTYELGGVTAHEQPTVEALNKLLSQLEELNANVRSGQTSALSGAATEQPSRHREN